MNKKPRRRKASAIEDVRQVRRAIAREHRGNLRQHMNETNRIFDNMRDKLNLKVVSQIARH